MNWTVLFALCLFSRLIFQSHTSQLIFALLHICTLAHLHISNNWMSLIAVFMCDLVHWCTGGLVHWCILVRDRKISQSSPWMAILLCKYCQNFREPSYDQWPKGVLCCHQIEFEILTSGAVNSHFLILMGRCLFNEIQAQFSFDERNVVMLMSVRDISQILTSRFSLSLKLFTFSFLE